MLIKFNSRCSTLGERDSLHTSDDARIENHGDQEGLDRKTLVRLPPSLPDTSLPSLCDFLHPKPTSALEL